MGTTAADEVGGNEMEMEMMGCVVLFFSCGKGRNGWMDGRVGFSVSALIVA